MVEPPTCFSLLIHPRFFAVTTSLLLSSHRYLCHPGLRSLYFVLAGAIGYFRYLTTGLSLVLVFIGIKCSSIRTTTNRLTGSRLTYDSISLLVVAGIILVAIVLSVTARRREETSD